MNTLLLFLIAFIAFLSGIGFDHAARESKVGKTMAREAGAKADQGRRQMWKFRVQEAFYLTLFVVCAGVLGVMLWAR